MADYEDLDPDFKEALMRKMKTQAAFWTLLGIELIDAKKGWSRVRLPFAKKLTHPLGVAHGGAVFSIADAAIGMALVGMLERDEYCLTVEMKISFIRPFKEGELVGEGKVFHKGTHTIHGEAEIKNAEGDLVAKSIGTYMSAKKRV